MVEKLEKIISQSQNIVFFGGAGVSTESGIPDFRSVDGLYHQKYDYPPETILSHTFWEERPRSSLSAPFRELSIFRWMKCASIWQRYLRTSR